MTKGDFNIIDFINCHSNRKYNALDYIYTWNKTIIDDMTVVLEEELRCYHWGNTLHATCLAFLIFVEQDFQQHEMLPKDAAF